MIMIQAAKPRDPEVLRDVWQSMRSAGEVRARDAAATLGVSEAELISSECGGRVTRLAGHFDELVQHLPRLGRVKAVTRNATCAHEKIGVYEDVTASPHFGLAGGADVDARAFYRRWRFGYAVREQARDDHRCSWQFFDASGAAVHKVYLQPEIRVDRYRALVADFEAAHQEPGESVVTRQGPAPEKPDSEIDARGLREAWAAMRHPHYFYRLLKQFKVTRIQALRLADLRFAYPLPVMSLRRLFLTAAAAARPVVVAVSNAAHIQIYDGPVADVYAAGTTLEVRAAADFRLRLREDWVYDAWAVRKPGADGTAASLEIFDAVGNTTVVVFGTNDVLR